MVESSPIGRRSFLYTAGVTAGLAALAACSSNSSTTSGSGRGAPGNTAPASSSGGTSAAPRIGGNAGSATKPLAKPAKFTEAPSLKGTGLPPVRTRLPDEPYVVPHHWVERGKYGGTLSMVAFGTTGMVNVTSLKEFFYGFSPTRWLNDGLSIGPGSADKWSSKSDATEWTVHFRTGLKWSDGHPFTVDDVLFWWEDIVLPGHAGQVPPLDCLSAAGNPCRMSKLDETTLKITYDAPQPLLPDYLAAWVKGGIGTNGPSWMMPKHYLKQFHPKYNHSVPKDWDSPGGLWEQKADWMRNPDCPTLTGYRCRSFDNNKGVVLERNPYYYAVTKAGDQLPYIDTITVSLVQTADVIKLQVQQGKVDFCAGFFNQIDLSDVSTLSRTKDQGGYRIVLWDSGQGAGASFKFNYDYIAKDTRYGKLIRDKRFMRAISLAYDRAAVQKTSFFGTGERTTGTMSPKALEFHVSDTGKHVYTRWRDAYIGRDVKQAKALLAQMGLKDTNNDGYVEFGDGRPLTIELAYSADMSKSDSAMADQVVASAKDAGLRMRRVPVSPQSWNDSWNNGEFMAAAAVGNGGDGPNLLIYTGWLLPFKTSNAWAPLETTWNSLTGTGKLAQERHVPAMKRHPPRLQPDPNGPIQRMFELYNQARRHTDPMKRHQKVWDIIKVHINEGPFFIGAVADSPQVFIAKTDLHNVPARDNLAQHGFAGPWTTPCPAAYDPETFYWTHPDQHTS